MNYFIENGSFAKVEKTDDTKTITQTTLADEIPTENDLFNGITRRRV